VHHIEQAPESVIVAAAQRVADDAEDYLDVWLSWIRIETA
jgi:hypothetical protein